MDNYIVSARKYRPSTFSDVVGQNTITQTLKNAVKTKHIAQAYLFCGPRGVGKTTCARILAKTINCFHITDEYEACNQCESCKTFNENRSLNIHELDAASNNSVDDIRNLVDKVRIPPQLGKYNIYIIDEVHMLSSQAFNAFLKTLEEPPAHAIFILATTEKHKILPTILSRCQIFDFNRIRIEDIVSRLDYVAKNEGITAEPDALNIIAHKADGAMRDALSTFDQIVSFSGNNITYKIVIDNLNVLDYDYYFKLTEAFLAEDYQTSLLIFDEILSKGFEGQYFLSGLSKHFRDLMVCKFPGIIRLLEVGAGIGEQYLNQAAKCTPDFLYACLEISNQYELLYKNSRTPRLLIELALLKLCHVLKKKEPESDNLTTDNQIVVPQKPVSVAKQKPILKREEISSISVKEALKSTTNGKITESLHKNPEVKHGNNSIENQNKATSIAVNTSGNPEITDLKKLFLKFAEDYSENTRLYNFLINSDPNFKDNTLALKIANNQLIDEFEKNAKTNLENYLKSKINIEVKSFSYEIIQNNDVKLMTSAEKLMYFIEKNPNVMKLKKRFNLEI